MLFANIIGDFFFYGFLLFCFALAMLKKILVALDEGGEIKQKANEGIAQLIQRYLK